jgi:nucleoside-diphosphate-sugar epimerase
MSSKLQRRSHVAGVIAIHALLAAFSYYFAYLLRYDFAIPDAYLRTFLWTLPVLLVVRTIAFAAFGLHHRFWRFSGVSDLIALGWATMTSTIVFGLTIAAATGFKDYPRSVLIIDLALALLLGGGARLAARVFAEKAEFRRASYARSKVPALILGAGNAAERLLRDLQRNPNAAVQPVGLVDDDPRKLGVWVHGVRVLGGTNALESLVERTRAKLIVIAIPSATNVQRLRLVKRCVDVGLPFRVVPSLSEFIDAEGQAGSWGDAAARAAGEHLAGQATTDDAVRSDVPARTGVPTRGHALGTARRLAAAGAQAVVSLDRRARRATAEAWDAFRSGALSRRVSQFLKFCVNRDLTRVVYDAFVTVAATAAAYLFADWYLRTPFGPHLLLPPIALLALNTLFGVYSRLRTAEAAAKAVTLTASLLLSVTLTAVAFGLSAPLVLWALLCAAPLILPRLLVNVEAPTRGGGFIKQVMRSRGPVAVVGGAGYIGSHLVEQLLNEGFGVRVIDRLMYGAGPLKEFMDRPNFELIEGDATDIMKLTMALNGASAVVHLGGLVGDPACALDEQFTRHANVIATRMVKEVARSFGIPRFVFASSCSVYGINDKEVNEKSEPNPVSLYARTKIDSERELLSSQEKGFDVTVLRFATVFGHSRRPRFDLVANLFTAQGMVEGKILLMGPKQWRPFVHVRDLARAIVAVLKAEPEKVRGQVFNVGDKRLNMTIGQLAERVREHVALERPVEIVTKEDFADARNYAVSFEKIHKVLGFSAETLLDDGIQEMIEEFKKGTYGHYKAETYSNVRTTQKALVDFRNPEVASKLYRPLAELPA